MIIYLLLRPEPFLMQMNRKLITHVDFYGGAMEVVTNDRGIKMKI